MYDAYQSYADVSNRLRLAAASGERLARLWKSTPYASPLRCFEAYCELVSLAGFTHARPDYGITQLSTHNGAVVDVLEEPVYSTPFCQLLRFTRKDAENLPRVLLVAPMSGHFATLLRGTIRTLIQDHDVYVTDWINTRDIALSQGVFGMDEFAQHLIDFLRFLGPPAHVVAVCQPTVAALAAVSIMAEDNDPAQPASLTLMAGPLDVSVSPTKVNEFAVSKPIDWFRNNVIGTVPRMLPGAGRRVYPGFLQISGFMSMNAERHANAFIDLFRHRVEGEHEKADRIRTFYEEYFAIMDLDADFYLQTIETVFHQNALSTGRLLFKGRKVTPRAIKKTFLLTVEGEKDDICAVGQTLAAQDMCSGLRPYMKSHHLQAGVGHYGVFNGKRWDNQIYPVLRDHIQNSL
ncbi:polyhydroxyalkanoate depolymerase [Methylosinus sporium]|uniref:Polyhydroxyalkanoate depolymerase n=2 Tax=Methylocystaceae TaxID=31993 RepID=A0A549SUW8_METSR|nr:MULTISPECIES: polyhydroxyalkanoate depolymerase [Methylosinus]MBU3890221.1 polyhydroxyalkanoate depolymerase [Methylosinus sp. KRF6]TRL33429.1 polyhydroxyalkanoate depolymerase [Methylosinus sporium]